jgi:hypothetical protein
MRRGSSDVARLAAVAMLSVAAGCGTGGPGPLARPAVIEVMTFGEAVRKIGGSPLVARLELASGGTLTEDGTLVDDESVRWLLGQAEKRSRTAFFVVDTRSAPEATVADLDAALLRLRAVLDAAPWKDAVTYVIVGSDGDRNPATREAGRGVVADLAEVYAKDGEWVAVVRITNESPRAVFVADPPVFSWTYTDRQDEMLATGSSPFVGGGTYRRVEPASLMIRAFKLPPANEAATLRWSLYVSVVAAGEETRLDPSGEVPAPR